MNSFFGVDYYPEHWPESRWETDAQQVFKANIIVEAHDRMALLADLTSQLASMRVMIYAVNVREPKDGNTAIHLTLGVSGLDHLQSVIERLSKIDGIYTISRGSYS